MKPNQTKYDRFTGEFHDFGSYLKYLRRRAGLGQRELGLAVGYGEAQISRLEHNHRLPELSMIRAHFIPALGLENQPESANRLVELAQLAHVKQTSDKVVSEEIGILEELPVVTGSEVFRTSIITSLKALFNRQSVVFLYGFPGVGKSVLAASFIRTVYGTQPIFWHTVSQSDPSPLETFIRQISLFLVSQGEEEAALFTQSTNISFEARISSIAEKIHALNPFICVDEVQHLRDFSLLENLIAKSQCRFLLVSREKLAISHVEFLPLSGMEEEETISLLTSMGLSLPTDVKRNLHALTQGNPMLLRLAGAKIQQNPSQAEKFIKILSSQREITNFLMENAMEGLSDSNMNLLYLISIFREPVNLFNADLANRLHSQGVVDDLNHSISNLQKRQFLDNPSGAYLHPLLQEHLNAVIQTRRDSFYQFHLLAANHLRATTQNIVEPLFHLTQTEQVEETILYLQENLLKLDATGQGEAAADLISSMLTRIKNSSLLSEEQEVQLLSIRGQLLMSGRHAADAEADIRQALALAIQSNIAPEARVSILLKLARFLLQRGKVPEADQLCDEVEKIPASHLNPGMMAETRAVRCTVRLMQSRFEESAELANQALKLVEPLIHREIRLVAGVRTMAYNTLGILANIQRNIPAAFSHWRNAEEAALLAGNLRTAFRIKGNIGALFFDQGEIDEARQSYEGILDAVQAIGDIFTLGKILNALGAIYHLQARTAEAIEMLDRAKQLKHLIGDVQGEATTDNQRAQVLLARGKAQDAMSIIERLLKRTEETGEMRWRASYLDTAGTILLALGEFTKSKVLLEEALALPTISNDPQLKTYLRNHLALAHLGSGEREKAESVFNATEGTLNSGLVAIESHLVEAILLAASGKPAEAGEKLVIMEKEASDLSLVFYNRISRQVMDSFEKKLSIPTCISNAMGAKGFAD